MAVWFRMAAVHFRKGLFKSRPFCSLYGKVYCKKYGSCRICKQMSGVLAYAIGVAEPVMIEVDTFGTGKVCADDCLGIAIPLVFGVTPVQIRGYAAT